MATTEQENRELLKALGNSKIYHEYSKAFNDLTGLPLALRTAESWQLALHGQKHENTLCRLMGKNNHSCAACLQTQETIAQNAQDRPGTVTCALGLVDSAVAIKTGNRIVGYLQTGQVFQKKPGEKQFEKAWAQMEKWDVKVEKEQARKIFFGGRVMEKERYEASLNLLAIFAEQLGIHSNQILVNWENREPPAIRNAQRYIEDHQTEIITLDDAAKTAGMSSYYFCKMFRKHTGMNFTEYVSRVRLERAKTLLLNPNLRISEIAYEVGFQSLTHFNRTFKQIVGENPSTYREKLNHHA